MSNIKIKFGTKVREIRKSLDWSQEQLAAACKLNRTYVGGIERGERNISLINIEKISIALNVNPKELLEFDS